MADLDKDLIESENRDVVFSPEAIEQQLLPAVFVKLKEGIEGLKANSMVRGDSDNLQRLAKLDKVELILAPELKKYLEEHPEVTSAEEVLKNCFSHLGEAFKYQNGLQNLEDFHKFGIIPEKAVFLASFQLVPYWQAGGESWSAVDFVLYLENGEVKSKPVVKKAITVMFAGEAVKSHLARLADLEQRGIPIVKIYGEEKAAIYQDLYQDSKKQVLADIKADPIKNAALLEELVRIAYVLDSSGYSPLNYLADMIFDGTNFRYVDGGQDLSDRREKPDPKKMALQKLIEEFPALKESIENSYSSFSAAAEITDKVESDVGEVL